MQNLGSKKVYLGFACDKNNPDSSWSSGCFTFTYCNPSVILNMPEMLHYMQDLHKFLWRVWTHNVSICVVGKSPIWAPGLDKVIQRAV